MQPHIFAQTPRAFALMTRLSKKCARLRTAARAAAPRAAAPNFKNHLVPNSKNARGAARRAAARRYTTL